jgi:hypothetical protein
MNTRRKLLLALAATLSTPRLALAPEKIRRIVWFGPGRVGAPSPYLAALQSRLRDLGWEEGRSISISPYWIEGTPRTKSAWLSRCWHLWHRCS